MKYAIFFLGLFLLTPAGAVAAAYSRRIRELVFGLLVFSTAFTDWYDINFVERWWYAGSTRGIEISFIDLLTLILLLSTLATIRREGARLFWPASLGLMLIYLGYGCLSVATSDPKLFGLFELTKLLRGLLVFLAVAWYMRTRRDIYALLCGLGAALTLNGTLAVWQRYAGAMYRVQGTFPHENALGDYCLLTAPLLLAAAFLNLPLALRGFGGVAWTAAAVATVLTISRMPAVAFLAASAGVIVTMQGFAFDRRRLAIAGVACVLAMGLFYRGADQLAARHDAAQRGTGDTLRTNHYAIGATMAHDHLFGVGLNNWGWRYHEYTHVSDQLGGRPYESTSDPGDGYATQGHTLYGLTLGELGWPGLLLFLALIAQWLFLSGSLLVSRPASLWSGVGAACFWGFFAEFVANSTEITFRNQQVFIVFNVLIGFVIAARRQSGMRLESRPRG